MGQKQAAATAAAAAAAAAANRGTVRVREWTLLESAEQVAATMRAADEAALPSAPVLPSTARSAAASQVAPGDAGNSACEVEHLSSVPVPCSSCGVDDGQSARLAFFAMKVPHFGDCELVSCE